MATAKKAPAKPRDPFTRLWIKNNSYDVIKRYRKGELTLRSLYYQLVSIGMTNSIQHYKRVVAAMIEARREGNVAYDTFSDHDRETIGETRWKDTDVDDAIDTAKGAVKDWMTIYFKNRWENQPNVVEVWIEKKALIGTFQRVCQTEGVALAPCKGYPSLTFLHDAALRFRAVERDGKTPVILYFGDYDPSGEDIPRSLEQNLLDDFGVDVTVERIALMEDQVLAWKLPPAPAKQTDSRTANWGGLGQVELDAVDPKKLQGMVRDAVAKYFDTEVHDEIKETEKDERKQYVSELKDFVIDLGTRLENGENLNDDDDDE